METVKVPIFYRANAVNKKYDIYYGQGKNKITMKQSDEIEISSI